MAENKTWYQGILNWIKEVVPMGFALVLSVYHYMRQKLLREEARHDKTKLQNEELQNEIAVDKELDGKSDRDVIDDAISEGAKLRDKS